MLNSDFSPIKGMLTPSEAQTSLEQIAGKSAWYRRLIVTQKGTLEKTFFLNAWLEDIKGFLGLPSLTDNHLIKLKALELVVSLGKKWENPQKERIFIQSLAQQAGLAKESTFNELQAKMATVSNSVLSNSPEIALIHEKLVGALQDYQFLHHTYLEKFKGITNLTQYVFSEQVDEGGAHSASMLDTESLTHPHETEDIPKLSAIDVKTREQSPPTQAPLQSKWINVSTVIKSLAILAFAAIASRYAFSPVSNTKSPVPSAPPEPRVPPSFTVPPEWRLSSTHSFSILRDGEFWNTPAKPDQSIVDPLTGLAKAMRPFTMGEEEGYFVPETHPYPKAPSVTVTPLVWGTKTYSSYGLVEKGYFDPTTGNLINGKRTSLGETSLIEEGEFVDFRLRKGKKTFSDGTIYDGDFDEQGHLIRGEEITWRGPIKPSENGPIQALQWQKKQGEFDQRVHLTHGKKTIYKEIEEKPRRDYVFNSAILQVLRIEEGEFQGDELKKGTITSSDGKVQNIS